LQCLCLSLVSRVFISLIYACCVYCLWWIQTFQSVYISVSVSVIGGARERVLRADFKPLYLQEPWRSGRLYVRQKRNITDAVEADALHVTNTSSV